MHQPNIIFDMWPEGGFTQKDVTEMENIISNFYSTSGQTSSNIRGLDVQTTIQFVSLAIVTGFFANLGADIYKHFKERFAKVLTNPIKKSKEQGFYKHGDCGIIWINTRIEKIDISMTCVYVNKNSIYKFIRKMNEGLKWLNSEIQNQKINLNQAGEIEFTFIDLKEENPIGWHYTNNKLLYEIKIKKKENLIKVRDGKI